MREIFLSLTSPGPNLFSIGSFTIKWYGVLIALSAFIGLNLSSKLADINGLKREIINDLFPILVFSSVIGARIYYVIFEWSNYSGKNFWGFIYTYGIRIAIPNFLKIWEGGIAIHGALIAGSLSIMIFCKLKEESFWSVLDVILPSVVLGQAIGRWGNFFNNEAFGLPTELPWKLFIPVSNRPEILIESNYFHPTFLYESLWNICIFILLISLFRIKSKGLLNLPPGVISCIYLSTYSIGRLWIEGLRIDPLCLTGMPPFCSGGIKIAQLVSIILIGIGGFGLTWIYIKKRKMPDFRKVLKKQS